MDKRNVVEGGWLGVGLVVGGLVVAGVILDGEREIEVVVVDMRGRFDIIPQAPPFNIAQKRRYFMWDAVMVKGWWGGAVWTEFAGVLTKLTNLVGFGIFCVAFSLILMRFRFPSHLSLSLPHSLRSPHVNSSSRSFILHQHSTKLPALSLHI